MLDKAYTTVDFLKKSLDGSWLKHKAISNNIANVNTPGYKRITVNFQSALRDALNNRKLNLSTTDNRHISNSISSGEFKPIVKEEKGYSTRRDGNNVNIDVENAELAKNTLLYESLIRQVSGEFDKIKNILREGGR